MTGTVRRLVLCAALCSIAVHAERGDGIDWQRGLVKAMGKGAPDLNAPSIAVARAAAERAALVAAQRKALQILQEATLDDGSRIEALLRDDLALRTRVESKLRGVRAARTRYFVDGGVWLDIEVPFGILPARIAEHLRAPGDVAPDAGTPDVAPDAGRPQGDAGEQPR